MVIQYILPVLRDTVKADGKQYRNIYIKEEDGCLSWDSLSDLILIEFSTSTGLKTR